MRVLKFGGTSVGTADRMQEVADIIEKERGRRIIVLSAMAGTTNDLISICESVINNNFDRAHSLLDQFEVKYRRVLTDLFAGKEVRDEAREKLMQSIKLLRKKIVQANFSIDDQRIIEAQGELISTRLFQLLCRERGIQAELIPALDFMRINKDGEPDLELTGELVMPIVESFDEEVEIIITQGYICKNAEGKIDNLRRGGSDYTATILGACMEVDEVQIWTDIDGVHNNDPRIVDDTRPLRYLSYREAAELAYFGAKILHPTCVLPVEKANVPLRLKHTMAPSAPGTLISNQSSRNPITAIAAKDGISAIKIYSHRMLQAYGFLKRVFQIFESYHTSVDMITTSEVAVSLTIDQTSSLKSIIDELSKFSEVDFDDNYSIICIVGCALYDDSEYVHRVFQCLEGIPLRMVSMGGSRNNISLLVKTEVKKKALVALNKLFQIERTLEPASILVS